MKQMMIIVKRLPTFVSLTNYAEMYTQLALGTIGCHSTFPLVKYRFYLESYKIESNLTYS